MPNQWYLKLDPASSQVQGPISDAKLLELARRGTLVPESLVALTIPEKWRPASRVGQLFERARRLNEQENSSTRVSPPESTPICKTLEQSISKTNSNLQELTLRLNDLTARCEEGFAGFHHKTEPNDSVLGKKLNKLARRQALIVNEFRLLGNAVNEFMQRFHKHDDLTIPHRSELDTPTTEVSFTPSESNSPLLKPSSSGTSSVHVAQDGTHHESPDASLLASQVIDVVPSKEGGLSGAYCCILNENESREVIRENAFC